MVLDASLESWIWPLLLKSDKTSTKPIVSCALKKKKEKEERKGSKLFVWI